MYMPLGVRFGKTELCARKVGVRFEPKCVRGKMVILRAMVFNVYCGMIWVYWCDIPWYIVPAGIFNH